MTEIEKTEIIAIIDSEILKLTKRIEELKEFTDPIAPDDAIGRVSRMDAINNKSVFDASMRNIQTRLEQLNQILKITHNADFGICAKCRQSIPFERLKIRPEIRLCANCLKK
ncbi:MAG: TraR/DksA family transcriptional regulator [Bacteroidetes bacterium HGW-Bacteroidetes-4]|nr:MAG: TraR/DksA family transcriptional regulator [Bacteroidetes bacterium HGW-Bacteroidetes-4]